MADGRMALTDDDDKIIAAGIKRVQKIRDDLENLTETYAKEYHNFEKVIAKNFACYRKICRGLRAKRDALMEELRVVNPGTADEFEHMYPATRLSPPDLVRWESGLEVNYRKPVTRKQTADAPAQPEGFSKLVPISPAVAKPATRSSMVEATTTPTAVALAQANGGAKDTATPGANAQMVDLHITMPPSPSKAQKEKSLRRPRPAPAPAQQPSVRTEQTSLGENSDDSTDELIPAPRRKAARRPILESDDSDGDYVPSDENSEPPPKKIKLSKSKMMVSKSRATPTPSKAAREGLSVRGLSSTSARSAIVCQEPADEPHDQAYLDWQGGKVDGHWIWYYTLPGSGRGFRTMHCPRPGCANPVFELHPLASGKAADHLRKCGLHFDDEMDMVRKFSKVIEWRIREADMCRHNKRLIARFEEDGVADLEAENVMVFGRKKKRGRR